MGDKRMNQTVSQEQSTNDLIKTANDQMAYFESTMAICNCWPT